MLRSDRLPFQAASRAALLLALLGFLGTATRAGADDTPTADVKPLPAAFSKKVPESVADLKAIQAHVKSLLPKLIAATVNVRIGPGQGSGVIVSDDGYVLTAGHVSGTPGRKVKVTMPDGREVEGVTLGRNGRIDSGMIKITTAGKWPWVDMGSSGDLRKGQWCIAIGHPGGYEKGRSPVVRVGRVLDNLTDVIRTDCTLVGGDSGGPLFDMSGKVIGIHSRIAPSITANLHVPVDTYRDTWEVLAQGAESPYLGVQGEVDGKNCKITLVSPGSPAEKAGLKTNDIIAKFDGKQVKDFEDLVNRVQRCRPGQEVRLEVRRGEERVPVTVVVGKRPG
jgi:serine protease Do